MTHTLLTITGPSLSGKSTLENLLVAKYKMDKLTSFTTRPMREGEVDGEHYYFLNENDALKKIEDGEMAEYIYFQENWYGLLGSELQSKLQNNSCIAVVEPNGVEQLSTYCEEHGINHRSVFLTNTPTVLAARFLKRFQEDSKASPINYAKRLVNMIKNEQDWLHDFEYDLIVQSFDSGNESEIVEGVYHTLIWGEQT